MIRFSVALNLETRVGIASSKGRVQRTASFEEIPELVNRKVLMCHGSNKKRRVSVHTRIFDFPPKPVIRLTRGGHSIKIQILANSRSNPCQCQRNWWSRFAHRRCNRIRPEGELAKMVSEVTSAA